MCSHKTDFLCRLLGKPPSDAAEEKFSDRGNGQINNDRTHINLQNQGKMLLPDQNKISDLKFHGKIELHKLLQHVFSDVPQKWLEGIHACSIGTKGNCYTNWGPYYLHGLIGSRLAVENFDLFLFDVAVHFGLESKKYPTITTLFIDPLSTNTSNENTGTCRPFGSELPKTSTKID